MQFTSSFKRWFQNSYIVFGVALTLRILWWGIAEFVGGFDFALYDTAHYQTLAENMMNHGVFSRSVKPPFYPDIARTPGYPAFLIPFYALEFSHSIIALAQSILGAFVPVLVLKSARLLQLQKPHFGVILMTFDLSFLVFMPMIMTDGLFTVLVAWLIYLLICADVIGRGYVWCGLIIGVLILIRPLAQFLPLLFIAWWLYRRVKVRALLVSVLVMLALPGGWSIRNQLTFQTPAISSMGQNGLLLYNAAGVLADVENRPFTEVQSEIAAEAFASQDWYNDSLATKKYMAWSSKKARAILAEHPGATAKQIALNLGYFFTKPPRSYFDISLGINKGYQPASGLADDRDTGERIRAVSANTSKPALVLMTIQLILNFILLFFTLLGLLALWRSNRTWAYFFALFIGYFWFISVFTQTDSRFRLPVLPAMTIVACASANLNFGKTKFAPNNSVKS